MVELPRKLNQTGRNGHDCTFILVAYATQYFSIRWPYFRMMLHNIGDR